MKISVITVCLNSFSTLERSIISLQKQGFQDWEHIIVDGGSTDGTLELIKSYESKKLKFISEKDDGVYDAFNKGILLSQGDFICFLNSDDWFESDFLTNAYQILIESNADWVFGDNLFHFSDYSTMEIKGDPLYFLEPWRDFSRFHHTTVLCKRSMFNSVGLFKTNLEYKKKTYKLKIASDYLWFLTAQDLGFIGCYSSLLTGHMQWGGLSTSQQRRAVKEALLIVKFKYGKNRKIQKVWKQRLRRGFIIYQLNRFYKFTPVILRRIIRFVIGAKFAGAVYEKIK